jgi:ketosteroid isomerase-like protein
MVSAVVVLLLVFPSVNAQEGIVDADTIRNTDARWRKNLAVLNLDAVMKVYPDGAVVLASNQSIVVGKPPVREWFSRRLSTPRFSWGATLARYNYTESASTS